MVSKNDKKYIIWPIYFDRSISKQKGRRVPKKYAIEKPSIEIIKTAEEKISSA